MIPSNLSSEGDGSLIIFGRPSPRRCLFANSVQSISFSFKSDQRTVPAILLTYTINTEIPLSIELVDLFGQKIKTVLPKQIQQTGNYTFQMQISDLCTGTYFLTISSTNQTNTVKIIINH